MAGWGADFPTASGMFVPTLSCRSFDQDPTNTGNYAGFCDPHADQLASQAQAAQLTDPATARKLWAQVDRNVTDQAPWAPDLQLRCRIFVSPRIGNYQQSFNGPLVDEMWVPVEAGSRWKPRPWWCGSRPGWDAGPRGSLLKKGGSRTPGYAGRTGRW